MTPEHDADLTPDGPDEPGTLGSWLARNAVTLAFVAAAVGFAVYKGWDFVLIAKVALGLGFVIFIHELGHFAAAKWCDVHVETFSIGFGPPLPGCVARYGETTYMLALFPLGGYVKMVGEGSEGEEGEDDPRSFKNKSVGQRMFIISSGVVMNVLLAAVCFVVVFLTTGVYRVAGVVGSVDAGSPAWVAGLRPGSVLSKVGTVADPFFDIDLMPEVMHWPAGQPMPVVAKRGDKAEELTITPRPNDTQGRQMIGVGQPLTTQLRKPNRHGLGAALDGSPAARAEPPLRNGDWVVGATDPDDPSKLTPLPPDPRNPQSGRGDYFDLNRRLQRQAGREVTILVKHDEGPKGSSPEEVRIPPAFHLDVGLRMKIGQVVAVRHGSPAARAGIQAQVGKQEVGDVLTAVEVPAGAGKALRFVDAPGGKVEANVEERPLDPLRLPFELQRWAESRPVGSKTVRLTLQRPSGHKEHARVVLDVDWDESWRYDHSVPSSANSPLAIDELGLAYQVLTIVEDVVPESPAGRAGLHRGDVIRSVGYFDPKKPNDDKPSEWAPVEPVQWANEFLQLQLICPAPGRFGLRFTRGETTREEILTCDADHSWPLAERGLRFELDTRVQKADGLGAALAMGVRDTTRQIGTIYQNLRAMITGQVSFKKNASGPLMIAAVAYDFAGRNLPEFLLFLAMISINLAVINFLPIPVLDGGHMVFLSYEWLRGRPAPEQVRVAATFVGVAFILSLMLFVTYLDVRRFWG